MSSAMNEHYFESRGLSYRMNQFRSDRQTILFIHGLTGTCSAWYEYERIFCKTYNLVSVDIRGHGKSIKYEKFEDYRVDKFVQDVAELIRHIQIERFIIVSHSFGTLIALELALTHADRIAALILLCPAYDVQAFASRMMMPLLKLAAGVFRLLPFSAGGRGRVDYSKYPQSGDFNVWRSYADIRNTSLRVHIFCLLQIHLFDQTGKWERLQMPILVIHGRKDRIIPVQQAEHMKMSLPAIRLLLLDGADHLLILNNVSEVSAAIKEFIERTN